MKIGQNRERLKLTLNPVINSYFYLEVCLNMDWRSGYMARGPASWFWVFLPLQFHLGSNEQKPYTGS